MPLFCALICEKAVKAKSRPIVTFVTFFIYMLYYFSRDAAYRKKNEDIKKGCRLLFFQMNTPKAIGALTDYRFSYSEKAVAGCESRVCVMFMGAKVRLLLCLTKPFFVLFPLLTFPGEPCFGLISTIKAGLLAYTEGRQTLTYAGCSRAHLYTLRRKRIKSYSFLKQIKNSLALRRI